MGMFVGKPPEPPMTLPPVEDQELLILNQMVRLLVALKYPATQERALDFLRNYMRELAK